MSKYGVRDILDLKVYGVEGFLFEINTAKANRIERDFEKGTNKLIIKEALVDMDLLNDILQGKYDNKNLRLVGYTYFRDAITMKEVKVKFTATIAKLCEYNLHLSCEGFAIPKLVFYMPTKDAYGFMNMNMEVLS